MIFQFIEYDLSQQARSHDALLNWLRGQWCNGKTFRLHIARANKNPFDDFGCDLVELTGPLFANLFPTVGLDLDFLRLDDDLMLLQIFFGQHTPHGIIPRPEAAAGLGSESARRRRWANVAAAVPSGAFPDLHCVGHRNNGGYGRADRHLQLLNRHLGGLVGLKLTHQRLDFLVLGQEDLGRGFFFLTPAARSERVFSTINCTYWPVNVANCW